MKTEKIPFTVIGGFLGSGKTTLLNHLLNTTSGRRIAVLVNDFGPINIDSRLIAQHDGKTISLSNGCICCSIGSGLDAALIDVLAMRPVPDWIVVEASGISDPGPIADVALTEAELRLAGIVTLLDAEHIQAQHANPLLYDTLVRQISGADLLILNKVDLLDSNARRQCHHFLNEKYPNIPMLETTNARIPEDILFDIDPQRTSEEPPRGDHGRRIDELHHPFASVTWSAAGVLSADRLIQALRSLPRNVVRAKGVVITDYHGPAVVHFAGRRVQIQAADTLTPEANEIVFIGIQDNMNNDELHALMGTSRLRP